MSIKRKHLEILPAPFNYRAAVYTPLWITLTMLHLAPCAPNSGGHPTGNPPNLGDLGGLQN